MQRRFKNLLLRTLQQDLQHKNEFDPFRRKFLRDSITYSSGVALGLSALSGLSACNKGNNNNLNSVGIVGGGLAGLSLAYFLQQEGIDFTLYEASDRVGGRVQTIYDGFGKGQLLENGGTFIDTDHQTIIDLVESLGLSLVESSQSITQDVYSIEGKRYTYQDCLNELTTKALAQFEIDYNTLPEFIESGNVHLWELYDAISLDTYLRALKISNWFRTLLCNAYEAEFGLKATEMSAMNFISLFEPSSDVFLPYGESDKLLRIKEGNEALCRALHDKCKDSIMTQHAMKAVTFDADSGNYSLKCQNKDKELLFKHKYVVLTVPFSQLKKCEIDAPITAIRKQAIQETLYGQHTIQHYLFHEPIWENQNLSGKIITDKDFQTSQFLASSSGSKLATLQTKSRVDFRSKTESSLYPDAFKIAFPGAELAFIESGQSKDWLANEEDPGSISCLGIGQWSKFYGSEEIDEGNIYFAGEHVSRIYRGTMNGAVDSSLYVFEKIKAKMQAS